MQKLPSTVQTDSRKLVEDLYDFLGTIVQGWRLIAVCVGITLALAVIYLARVKPVYLASARLLVLQHGGQPLTVANGTFSHDNLFQSVDGSSNSLTTHIMIIRSPLIVGRSLAVAGLKESRPGRSSRASWSSSPIRRPGCSSSATRPARAMKQSGHLALNLLNSQETV